MHLQHGRGHSRRSARSQAEPQCISLAVPSMPSAWHVHAVIDAIKTTVSAGGTITGQSSKGLTWQQLNPVHALWTLLARQCMTYKAPRLAWCGGGKAKGRHVPVLIESKLLHTKTLKTSQDKRASAPRIEMHGVEYGPAMRGHTVAWREFGVTEPRAHSCR
jgi:hypothetical protein